MELAGLLSAPRAWPSSVVLPVGGTPHPAHGDPQDRAVGGRCLSVPAEADGRGAPARGGGVPAGRHGEAHLLPEPRGAQGGRRADGQGGRAAPLPVPEAGFRECWCRSPPRGVSLWAASSVSTPGTAQAPRSGSVISGTGDRSVPSSWVGGVCADLPAWYSGQLLLGLWWQHVARLQLHDTALTLPLSREDVGPLRLCRGCAGAALGDP